MVTFPAAEHHCPLADTKLYCLVREAHRCEQLAQGYYAAFDPSRIWTHDLLITRPTLYLLRHCATSDDMVLMHYYRWLCLADGGKNRQSVVHCKCLAACSPMHKHMAVKMGNRDKSKTPSQKRDKWASRENCDLFFFPEHVVKNQNCPRESWTDGRSPYSNVRVFFEM